MQLSKRKKTAFSAGNFSVNLIAQAFATYIYFYYVDVLGVRPVWVGTAMVIHGIFNAALNPLLGYLSDRTQSRWGRRLPYILFGSVPFAAAFVALWSPFVSGSALLWYFLIAVLLYDVLFVLVVLNYSALFPEMFVSVKERSYVSALRQAFGILGMILGVAIPPLLYTSIGWGAMGLGFGVIALVGFALAAWGSKENPEAPIASVGFIQAIRFTFTNRSFVMYVIGSFFVQFTFTLLPAVIPFYTKYVLRVPEGQNSIFLGAIFLSAIVFVSLWSRWTSRFGPRKTVLAAVFCYIVALAPFAVVDTFLTAVLTAVLVGFCLAGMLVLLDVLLSEVIDEDERKTGARREGMYFGMNGFIVRWGVSLQALIMSVVLETSGYVKDAAEQSAATVLGIRLMLSGIPIAALLLALIFYYWYPIGKSEKPKAKTNQIHM